MNYAEHKANIEAEANAWMEAHESELEAVVQVGTDESQPMYNPRPKSDSRLLLDGLTQQVRERQRVKATATVRKESQEPTSDMANSLNDPDVMGFYAAGRSEAKAANKARAFHGIEYVLNVRGAVRGGKSGKTRETKAEKRARLANRYAK